jgi:Toprim-like
VLSARSSCHTGSNRSSKTAQLTLAFSSSMPGGPGPLPRLAVCEAAIDAMSLAALEGERCDTLYAATAGGIGPATIAALQELLRVLASDPAGLLIAATDADRAGRRTAARLAALAMEAGVRFDAILPLDGLNDWNNVLCALGPVALTPDRVLHRPPALLIDRASTGKNPVMV